MGILRTDKLSGLETPTAVTGSVYFDGVSNDSLQIANNTDFNFPGDFTIECWAYSIAALDSYNIEFAHIAGKGNGINALTYALGLYQSKINFTTSNSGGTYTVRQGSSVLTNNTWYHFAVTRHSNTLRLFVNGKEDYSATVSDDLTNTKSFNIGDRESGDTSANYPLNGYVSNLRVLKGTALYTSDFTPPVHELQPIGDTVLLCCNNPDSAGADGTGKTITVKGDAVASTVSPGLTRDFTYGTEFRGVTTFDTQGYFVPPSGTTEQRGRGRGIFAGGGTTPSYTNAIDFITISSSGNAQDFGDLTQARQSLSGTANSTRGIFASGYIAPGNTDRIDYISIASQGNAVTFGTIASSIRYASCAANSTRGLIAGGYTPSYIDRIEYITIAALGDAVDFGDLTANGTATDKAGLSSPTRALFAGGEGPSMVSQIDYVTIATLGNAADFGDLTAARRRAASASSGTRGLVANGYNGSAYVNNIDYVTIASTGNAQDFGDSFQARSSSKGQVSSTIRGVFGSGSTPSSTNTIDSVNIASTGNAQDFGDTNGALFEQAGCSDSHGGIS